MTVSPGRTEMERARAERCDPGHKPFGELSTRLKIEPFRFASHHVPPPVSTKRSVSSKGTIGCSTTLDDVEWGIREALGLAVIRYVSCGAFSCRCSLRGAALW